MKHGPGVAVCYSWSIGHVGKNRWTSIFIHLGQSLFLDFLPKNMEVKYYLPLIIFGL